MAKFLGDGEFWLPPMFLTEDDPFIDNRSFSPKATADLFSSVYGSDLGSPVESLFGTTEIESDEEDMLANLSRNISRSTLDDGFKNSGDGFGFDGFEARFLSRSPQSTLHPTNFDMIFPEVARRTLKGELYGRNGTGGFFAKQKQHSPVSVSVKALNPDASRHAQTSIMYHQLLEFQILRLKKQRQQMMMKQQQQQQRSDSALWGPTPKEHHICGRKAGRPLGQSPAAWPSLQQMARHQRLDGSGMTAVFLPAKKECAGTGVFLPRRAGPQPEQRKKPACSTALIPAKVVYALNLENVDPHQPHLPYRFNGGDGSCNVRRSGAGAYQNRSARSQLMATSPEIRLPQEWTY